MVNVNSDKKPSSSNYNTPTLSSLLSSLPQLCLLQLWKKHITFTNTNANVGRNIPSYAIFPYVKGKSKCRTHIFIWKKQISLHLTLSKSLRHSNKNDTLYYLLKVLTQKLKQMQTDEIWANIFYYLFCLLYPDDYYYKNFYQPWSSFEKFMPMTWSFKTIKLFQLAYAFILYWTFIVLKVCRTLNSIIFRYLSKPEIDHVFIYYLIRKLLLFKLWLLIFFKSNS